MILRTKVNVVNQKLPDIYLRSRWLLLADSMLVNSFCTLWLFLLWRFLFQISKYQPPTLWVADRGANIQYLTSVTTCLRLGPVITYDSREHLVAIQYSSSNSAMDILRKCLANSKRIKTPRCNDEFCKRVKDQHTCLEAYMHGDIGIHMGPVRCTKPCA